MILSSVVREVEDPGGDDGMNLEKSCDGTGFSDAPAGSKADISAYTSCLILPGHDLKPS